jgi:hypothetical protein
MRSTIPRCSIRPRQERIDGLSDLRRSCITASALLEPWQHEEQVNTGRAGLISPPPKT